MVKVLERPAPAPAPQAPPSRPEPRPASRWDLPPLLYAGVLVLYAAVLAYLVARRDLWSH